MESLISSSDNLKALYSFNDFISKERTSFRLVSSETATMLTMNDATIIHEKHHVTMRKIQAEVYTKIAQSFAHSFTNIATKFCSLVYKYCYHFEKLCHSFCPKKAKNNARV